MISYFAIKNEGKKKKKKRERENLHDGVVKGKHDVQSGLTR